MTAVDWLPLLRTLTEECPSWLVWKNVDAAFEGRGDIDAAIPAADAAVAIRAFERWARQPGILAALVCRHWPGYTQCFVVDRSAQLLQLDLMHWTAFRGGITLGVRDLLPLAVDDTRGFRRLRPGAEAGLLLLFNGLRRGGRADWTQIRTKALPARLAGDPQGLDAVATAVVGARAEVLVTLARRVIDGNWDARRAWQLELLGATRAVRHPTVALRRVYARLPMVGRCVLGMAVMDGRKISGDVSKWLQKATRGHEVLFLREGLPMGKAP